MEEVEKNQLQRGTIAFWHGLVGAIETGLDEFNYRSDKPTKIWEGEPNTICVKWGEYVFIVDLIDGLYVGTDELGEFMYYHHAEIPVHTDDSEYGDGDTFQTEVAPLGADWYNIRVIDAIIDRAKTFAHIDMISDHAENTNQMMYKFPDDGVRRYITKKGIHAIKKLFENAFTSLLGIDKEVDKDSYSINAYPSYTSDTAVIIHVQLDEFDDKGYVNKDNAEFFLTINMVDNSALITPDLPWIMPADFNAELYTLLPSHIDTDKSLLSAIRIAVDDMMFRVHQQCDVDYLFDTLDRIDLMDDKEVVQKFRVEFEKYLKNMTGANADAKLVDGVNFLMKALPSGITRMIVGKLVVDVYINGLGLADVGTTVTLAKDEPWDSIIWNTRCSIDIVPKTKTLEDINGVRVYQDIILAKETSTEMALRTMCDVVQSALKRTFGSIKL